jgi:LysM repeat protein
VAAALCLAPQAASAATVPPTASSAAAAGPAAAAGGLDAFFSPAIRSGQVLAVTRQQAAARLLHSAAPHSAANDGTTAPATYKVRPGDTFASIAARFYHDPAAWTAVYWSNHASIRWADDIYAGQVLRIPARPDHIPRAPGALQSPAVTAVPAAGPTGPAPSQPATAADATYSGGVPGGAFGQCVIARESGGNAQIMNATGHYGLYQFSAATWAAYGGNPADFGNASVAEQNQVFANALAAGGESNWAPYDGC